MKSQPKILIADDSPTVTGILSYIFTEEGFQVVTAADGIEALKRFYEDPPDVVVLDIEMPRMKGYQVCRVLKDDPQTSQVPIVILSSRDLQSDRFRGRSSGADAYIVKNLEDDQLIVTVRRMIENKRDKQPIVFDKKSIAEGDLLERINSMLDRKLFISGINNRLQYVNRDVNDFTTALIRVVQLFSSIFEFVVGGVYLAECDPPQCFLAMVDGFESKITSDFNRFLLSQYQEKTASTSKMNSELKVVPNAGTGNRMFPVSSELTSKLAWSLQSRGKIIGVIGMGATAPLKFDIEGDEVLSFFRDHAAVVLDNAVLVRNQIETNRQLTTTLKELKSTQSQLIQSEKLASLGQLTAGLVHEMNNPLNFIAGNIDHVNNYVNGALGIADTCIKEMGSQLPESVQNQLYETDLDFIMEDLPSIFTDIKEGLNRAQSIIRDLRLFSAKGRDDMVPTDLRELIDSTINILKREWNTYLTIEKNFGEMFYVECNPGQIGQVLMNLFTNAIHAIRDTQNTGKLTISLRQEVDEAVLEVSDTGVGIPPDNIEKLFQPFFTTREVGSGMGLGLSITHGIIKRHDGEIRISSTVGKGTTFMIRMPLKAKTNKSED